MLEIEREVEAMVSQVYRFEEMCTMITRRKSGLVHHLWGSSSSLASQTVATILMIPYNYECAVSDKEEERLRMICPNDWHGMHCTFFVC